MEIGYFPSLSRSRQIPKLSSELDKKISNLAEKYFDGYIKTHPTASDKKLSKAVDEIRSRIMRECSSDSPTPPDYYDAMYISVCAALSVNLMFYKLKNKI